MLYCLSQNHLNIFSYKKQAILLTWLLLISTVGLSYNWVKKANFGGAARHRCTAFSVGNKGYVGGGHINSGVPVYHEDFWQYDPGSDTWTQIADFGGGKRYHSAAFSIGEFGYVGLGEDDVDEYHSDFYRYSPQYNIWQAIADMPGHPRRGAASFVIDGFAYVGTGQTDFGYEDDFYKYDPDANAWYAVADFIGEARSSAVSFSHNGKGYVGTGHIWGDHTKDFYEYDPVSNSWTQKADVGTTYRQDATGFVVGGKGYIGTGNDVDGNLNYKDFWEYDFDTDTWTQIPDLNAEGRRYMVSFVINGIAYAGTGTDGTNLKDFYMFDPSAASQNELNQFTIAPYPNPSSDQIHFNFNGEAILIVIYSSEGKEVFRKRTQQNITLSKQDFGKGIYYYLLRDEVGLTSNGKIIFL